jgi:predicted O-methyltransferase YrrM
MLIEVGTWKGASAIHLARLLMERNLNAHILCVDTWLGGLEIWLNREDTTFYQSLDLRFGYPSVYYQFLANVLHCGLEKMITPLPQTSEIAARLLRAYGVSADLVYIDASHDQHDLYRDMTNYWEIIKPGGALFGDDFLKWIGVRRAVEQFAKEHSLPLLQKGRQWVILKP